MAMSTLPGDALIPVQTVKLLSAITHGRWACKWTVRNPPADHSIPNYRPGHTKILPDKGRTLIEQRVKKKNRKL